MLVHVLVLLTLGGTFCACCPACLERGLDRGEVLPGATAEDFASGCAEIGAVKVEANAVP